MSYDAPSPWSREGAAPADHIVVAHPIYPSPIPVAAPPARQRGRWIGVGIVAFVALVIVGGAIGAGLARATRPTGQAAPHRTGLPVLSAPETFGPYTKQNQGPADLLAENVRNSGAEHPFGAYYFDDQGHTVIIWGGTGTSYTRGSDRARLDSMMAGTRQIGIDQAGMVDVDPGPRGGVARCAPTTGTGLTGAVCGWTVSGALLALVFGGVELSVATSRLPTVLSAIVEG